jgi:hypothetical protein
MGEKAASILLFLTSLLGVAYLGRNSRVGASRSEVKGE